jgi:arylsulfatase A-like enzyme
MLSHAAGRRPAAVAGGGAGRASGHFPTDASRAARYHAWRVKILVRCAALALSLVIPLPAGAAGRRPSVLLVVLDTVRVDAVSAYGRVDGTTPNLDRLAREGVRYTHAYAASNWTVPSHAAMFTGLRPSVTGMLRAESSLVGRHRTLATAVMLAGYDTAGFSENPWLSEALGFQEGFGRFQNLPLPQLARDAGTEPLHDLPTQVGTWLARRDPARPFFVFANIMDAHDPYPVSADNPFLPPWVPLDDAHWAVANLASLRCATDGREADLDLLWRLYLHGVRQADAKLGRLVEAVRQARPDDPLRIIVLADHGEHFGERRRIVHDIGLGEALIHVPLVIHGATTEPAVVDTPVPTADVFATIISWTGAWASGPGRVLPLRTVTSGPKSPVVAEYADPLFDALQLRQPDAFYVEAFIHEMRAMCRPEDGAWGHRRAVVDFPYKLIAADDRPPELYDLAADPQETRDLAAVRPEIVRQLFTQLPPFGTPGVPRASPLPILDLRRVEQLRALGYVVPGS